MVDGAKPWGFALVCFRSPDPRAEIRPADRRRRGQHERLHGRVPAFQSRAAVDVLPPVFADLRPVGAFPRLESVHLRLAHPAPRQRLWRHVRKPNPLADKRRYIDKRWWPAQRLALNTKAQYRSLLIHHILPTFGDRPPRVDHFT